MFSKPMNLSRDDLLKLEHNVSDLLKTLGNTLTQEWQHIQQVSLKENREPVTEFDIKIEKDIQQELAKLLPNAGFIVEEGDDIEGEEFHWIIDPIDQTKNFIGQIPLFYTQVALVHKEVPILGVIYNPVSGQLLSASRGNGTKLNYNPIAKSVKQKLDEALVDIDFGGNNRGLDWKIPALGKLAEVAYRIRITGGAFAPYLITGGIDAFVVLNEKTKVVDQMPRIILARELGLSFEILNIGNHKIYIAGSKPVFEAIKDTLSKSILPQV